MKERKKSEVEWRKKKCKKWMMIIKRDLHSLIPMREMRVKKKKEMKKKIVMSFILYKF